MEEFAEKEVPREVEKMQPMVETLDDLGTKLEAAKNEMMVSKNNFIGGLYFCEFRKLFSYSSHCKYVS